MRIAPLFIALLLSPGLALAEPFMAKFDWGDLPDCTEDTPAKVDNPRFVVTNLPYGTTVLVFKLRDLDAPNTHHGGGKIKMIYDGVVPPGSFTYKRPCPGEEPHLYEWHIIAKGKGEVLGVTKTRRPYPEPEPVDADPLVSPEKQGEPASES